MIKKHYNQHRFTTACFSLKRGDSLVEVMFAVGIFGMTAIGAIGIMNKGLYDAQKALEITMARQEIDAQAESIRFIHDATVAEQKINNDDNRVYSKLWDAVKSNIYSPRDVSAEFYNNYANRDCNELYTDSKQISEKSFVINTRRLNTAKLKSIIASGLNNLSTHTGNGVVISHLVNDAERSVFAGTPTFPRLVFTGDSDSDEEKNLSDRDFDADGQEIIDSNDRLANAEGIWVTGIASDNSSNPEFYDFHIRTCWHSPGDGLTSNISTIVRLVNFDHTAQTDNTTDDSTVLTVRYGIGISDVHVNGTRVDNGGTIRLVPDRSYSIAATTESGYEFDSWNATSGSVGATDLANSNYTMGSFDSTLTANGRAINPTCTKRYRLQYATGSFGSYVTESTEELPAGTICYYSKSQSGYSASETVNDRTAEGNCEVGNDGCTISLDLYRNKYRLTVTASNSSAFRSVSGSGRYRWGQTVTIMASPKYPEWAFNKWTLVSGEGRITNATSSMSSFVMESQNATVQASAKWRL